MNKKLYIFGGLVVIAIIAIGLVNTRGSSDKSEVVASNSRGNVEASVVTKATESLRGVLDAANQLYGIEDGAAFPYKALDEYGTSGNFGISKFDNGNGDRLVDEKFVKFQNANNTDQQGTDESAEVDSVTNKVIAFHRQPHYGFCKEDQKPPCGVRNQGELDIMVHEFLKKVEPDFNQLTSGLSQYKVDKKAGMYGDHYFFRWEDTEFKNQLPAGAETDNTPMIQVGITSTGFIFGYDNTLGLYHDALTRLETN